MDVMKFNPGALTFSVLVAAAVVLLGVGSFTSSTVCGIPNDGLAAKVGTESPLPLLGLLYAHGITCTLANGSCNMTLVNNSPVALLVESCNMAPVINSNSTVTTWGFFNGTVGGPASVGIPAGNSLRGSEVLGSCTIPTSDLSQAPIGSVVSGGFVVELASAWYNYPMCTSTGFGFSGTWS